jgi:Clostripain family
MIHRMILPIIVIALIVWTASFDAQARTSLRYIQDDNAPRTPPAASVPTQAEWTIMIFMNGDNNLEFYAIQDFLEMARVSDDPRVNVVIQFDRGAPAVNDDKSFGDWKQTLRFRMRRGLEPTVANAIEDLSEVDMGEGIALKNFITWVKGNYKANRYMLIIWDHGQGWRLPYTTALNLEIRSPSLLSIKTSNVSRATANVAAMASVENFRRYSLRVELVITAEEEVRPQISILPPTQAIESTLRAVSHDETSGHQLFNGEIQQTLQEVQQDSPRDERLHLIGFDACLMSMVETAYAMRKVAKVMVASEELEPGEGWDYSVWLQRLVDNPAIDETVLGNILVTSYKDTYENRARDTTLSAINLDKIDDLSHSISELAEHLRSNIDTQLPAIMQARNACFPYAPGKGLHGIDLGRFCKQISALTTDQQLRTKAEAVITHLSTSVISNYVGVLRQDIYKYGSNGLAIYFPESRTLYALDPYQGGYRESTDEKFPVEFVKSHRWDNFLHTYFEHVQ